MHTPSVGLDGSVFFPGTDGRLYAIRTNGTRKWTFRARAPLRCSPLVYKGVVYFGGEDKSLYAVNESNGKLRWRFPADGAVTTPPAITKGRVVFGTETGSIYAVDRNGRREWLFRTDAPFNKCAPAVGADGTVFFNSGSGRFTALRPDGKEKWRLHVDSTPGDPAIASDGTIYFGTWRGTVYALRPNGKVRWRFKANSPVASPPAVDGQGTIYAVAREYLLYACLGPARPPVTRLYAIRPDGTKAWDMKMPGFASSPVIGPNGRLYVNCSDGKLYAIGERRSR